MAAPCTFVRKNGDAWEYGVIRIDDFATTKEKRTHVVTGCSPTYEEALMANSMALEGQPKVRPNIEPQYWG